MTPATMPSTAPLDTRTDTHGSRWLAAHLHFSGNPNPLLYECIAPEVAQLRDAGLIAQFFFIRYWTEGQHVRVRLLPAEGVDPAQVRAEFDTAVRAFLDRRPFLLPAMQMDDPQVIKKTFLAEYPLSTWNSLYGEDGVMPVHEPGSILWTAYEPEFGRYGGVAGMELSERHFEASSDLVLELLATSNLHLRSIVLGAAAQIMASMTVTLLRSPELAAGFLTYYERRWRTGWGGLYAPRNDRFERAYQMQAEVLVDRVSGVLRSTEQAVSHPDLPRRSYLDTWARQCAALRSDIDRLTGEGRLVFPRGRDGVEWDIQHDPRLATHGLAFSYVHMLNNRLGVPIVDEIYLAFLLRRAFEDMGVRAVETELP